jgi:hypothetical protein
MEPYRKVARRNAEFLNVSYEELEGSSDLFRRLVCGPWEENFLVVERGGSIGQEMFLDL